MKLQTLKETARRVHMIVNMIQIWLSSDIHAFWKTQKATLHKLTNKTFSNGILEIVEQQELLEKLIRIHKMSENMMHEYYGQPKLNACRHKSDFLKWISDTYSDGDIKTLLYIIMNNNSIHWKIKRAYTPIIQKYIHIFTQEEIILYFENNCHFNIEGFPQSVFTGKVISSLIKRYSYGFMSNLEFSRANLIHLTMNRMNVVDKKHVTNSIISCVSTFNYNTAHVLSLFSCDMLEQITECNINNIIITRPESIPYLVNYIQKNKITPSIHKQVTDSCIDSVGVPYVDQFDQCVICHDILLTGDMKGEATLGCGHIYHLSCISRWMYGSLQQPRCPLCRSSIER